MTKEKLVPKLRFKEFSDEWGEVRLGEISTFLDNKRVPLKEDDRKHMQGEYPYYGASGIIDYINDYIFDEELILMGEDGANIVNRSTKLIFLAKGKYWVNNHAHVIKANEDINQYFLSECLERINYEKYNTGTAQPKLNREVCEKIKVTIPQINEQIKIANFLSKLEDKINLLEQKYQNYQDFKKYLMQQIFAQKLRFKGFEEEWQTCKFDDLFKFNVAGDMKKELFNEKCTDEFKYPLFANALEYDGLLGYYKEYKYEPNSITVTARGNVGHATVRNTKFNAVGRLIILTAKEDLNVDFFSEYINSNVKVYIESTGVPQLTAPSLKINKLKYPSLEEQNKIASFFKGINKKISLIQDQISQIENFKKGLLQQMFV